MFKSELWPEAATNPVFGVLATSRSPANPMRNTVQIDAKQSRAIVAEIGERLRPWMAVESELPPALTSLLERLRASEDRATSR